MNCGLKENTIAKINSVFMQYPEISQVILYGSRTRGNYRNGSDIDLTLLGDLSHSLQLKIERKLEDLSLPYKIDLSLLNEIQNPDLLDHIRRVGIVFYQKSPDNQSPSLP